MPFHILVPIKRVIDYNVRVRVKADGSDVETDNVKMSMNPFDEIALEEAVRLKEAGVAQTITVVSMGTSNVQETLRTALAMGADDAVLIQTEKTLQPLAIATLLKSLVDQQKPNLVLMGKQAIDDDCNQTGQMLAGLLDWPQATFASNITIANNQATVVREIDGGLETLCLDLPAIITVDLRLNQPRYISLPNIMKAKQKKITLMTAEAFGVDIADHLTLLKVEAPLVRKSGIKVQTVAELLDKLKNEAKVL